MADQLPNVTFQIAQVAITEAKLSLVKGNLLEAVVVAAAVVYHEDLPITQLQHKVVEVVSNHLEDKEYKSEGIEEDSLQIFSIATILKSHSDYSFSNSHSVTRGFGCSFGSCVIWVLRKI